MLSTQLSAIQKQLEYHYRQVAPENYDLRRFLAAAIGYVGDAVCAANREHCEDSAVKAVRP